MKSIIQKTSLIVFGIIIGIFLTEIGLRIAGYYYSLPQEIRNEDIDENEYKIMCVGESTTQLGGTNSWPNQLESILNNVSTRRVKVISEGATGSSSAYILTKFEENLDKHEPEMVISMMGINDDGLYFKEGNWYHNLRIYKLIRLIQKADVSEKSRPYPIPDGDELSRYINSARETLENSNVEGGEKILLEALNINPEWRPFIYDELGLIYLKYDRIDEAQTILEEAVSLAPDYARAHYNLGAVYAANNEIEKGASEFEKAIELNYESLESAHFNLHTSYKNLGLSDSEIEEKYRQWGYEFYLDGSVKDAIRHNHRSMNDILEERGIVYAAMQYPTRSIDCLKDLFPENNAIIFISNENFHTLIDTGNYDDYFWDSFGQHTDLCGKSTFGHATPKGNLIIAKNAADAILSEIK